MSTECPSSPEQGLVDGGPPPEAALQSDGSYLIRHPDGSSVRWTQRPDGSWRKPQRTRAGWVGELDRVKYFPPIVRGIASTTAASGVSHQAPGLPAAAASEGQLEETQAELTHSVEVVASTKGVKESGEKTKVKKHDLHHRWCLWVHQRPGLNHGETAWSDGQRCVHEFGTAEDFWCMIHHTHSPSNLGSSDYSLFRHQITPAWEDPAFKKGGRWVAKLEKLKTETLDDLWVTLTMALVGESFADYGGDSVCGAIVSVRHRASKAALWVSESARSERVLAIGHHFRSVLVAVSGLEGLEPRHLTFEYFGRQHITMELPELFTGKSTIGVFQ